MGQDQTAALGPGQPVIPVQCLQVNGDLANVWLQHPDVLFLNTVLHGGLHQSHGSQSHGGCPEFDHDIHEHDPG